MVEATASGISCLPADEQQLQQASNTAAAAVESAGTVAPAAAGQKAVVAAEKQTSAADGEAAAAAAAGDKAGGERLKPKPGRKRKVAMHMAYLGAGYHGMQRNPGCPTIEAELESALVKAGAISEQNAGSFMKIHWMRAARTDKGVSAACQVVSAKLLVDPVETFVERVNALLPQQIRVFGVQRATEGFDARKFCDKRKYEYILPAWVFDPTVCSHGRPPTAAGSGSSNAALQAVAAAVLAAAGADKQQSGGGSAAAAASDAANSEQQQQGADASEGQPPAAAAAAVDDAGDDASGAAAAAPAHESAASCHFDNDKLERIRAEVAAAKARYVFGPEQLSRLNAILSQYEGTHNFHNYTVKVAATDPAARRFIHSFNASCMSIAGEPWVKLVVVGQSFMLHQIRKMVGMALAVMRGVAAPGCLGLALDPDRDMNTPMAPELGLFLDETYYDAFNNYWGDLHGPVTFEPFRAAAEQFKSEVLYPHIASKDAQELVNALWLRNCTNACYKFTKWARWAPVRNMAALNAKAKQEAAAKRGARAYANGSQQQQGKRPADSAGGEAAADGDDDGAAEQPVAKQQRLDRPGRLDGATAAMVVGMQETYGMSPHHDTEKAAGARKELKEMRQEYQQHMQQQQQQQAEPEEPAINPEEALDSLYDLM